MEKEILISVVIPVKNGDIWIDDCIKSLVQQTLFPSMEIIVVDSGSTDNTLNILKQYPVRILTIPAESFNHGATRNFAVGQCHGDFILMMVQDARAVDENYVQKLLSAFTDEQVAGVCGQQVVPHEIDKNPLEWHRPVSVPALRRYQYTDRLDFLQLSPETKRQVCGWDNVAAMYRRRVLMEIPFQAVTFAEDALWARDALLNGYAIVYNPAAKVYHYHLNDKDFTFRRCFTIFYHFYKYFGYRPPIQPLGLKGRLRIIKILALEPRLNLRQKWKWLKYNLDMNESIRTAAQTFCEEERKGEKALDALHDKICKTPPTPKKFKI